jgi:mono/diheme cytochrome c family protein
MQPLPGPLQDAAGRWRARELAWIVRNGIRMSGMPAWGGRMDDADIWAVVAYLQWLRQASPALHAHTLAGLAQDDCALPAAAPGAAPAARLLVGLDGERQALRRHGCQGCHQVPGLVGSPSHVGPPLAGMARRTWIAGVLPNTPENLAAWIRDPQHHKPGSAMPALGVDARDAQLMAAYLGRLH